MARGRLGFEPGLPARPDARFEPMKVCNWPLGSCSQPAQLGEDHCYYHVKLRARLLAHG